MSRTLIFDSPLLLGFDTTRSLIERVSRTSESYPPYNVEALSDDHIRITLAVAGFTAPQLRIEVKGQQLSVIGQKEPQIEEISHEVREFLHRGVAQRGFSRIFVLGEGLVVKDALLEYGLLHIDLVRPQTEDNVMRIPIRTGR